MLTAAPIAVGRADALQIAMMSMHQFEADVTLTKFVSTQGNSQSLDNPIARMG